MIMEVMYCLFLASFDSPSVIHGVIESFRLEETFKIIKSSREPCTVNSATKP